MMSVWKKALRFGAGLFGSGRFRRCKQRYLAGPGGPGRHFAAGPGEGPVPFIPGCGITCGCPVNTEKMGRASGLPGCKRRKVSLK